MATIINIEIPDVGGADDVAVIEVLVKPGDTVAVDDALITLESDKATMDVPSTHAGVVKDVLVKVDDKVAEGTVILTLETEETTAAEEAPAAVVTSEPTTETMTVPDVGGADDVAVIEVLVNVGDTVAVDDALITLESDKATMEVPSTEAGTVKEILVSVGDKVQEGTAIVVLDGVVKAQAAATSATAKAAPPPQTAAAQRPSAPAQAMTVMDIPPAGTNVHASPAVRRIAREFGVDMTRVRGTGRKARVTVDDIRLYVKGELAKTQSGGGVGLPQAPVVDFSEFGEIEEKAFTRIQKLSSKGLHRNWLLVPHVTQFDDADITEMEAYRQKEKGAAKKQGFNLTPLVFIMKAVVSALQAFPRVNSSIGADGESIVLKKYFHVGVAVDTPDGLVVPVVRDVDQKSIMDLAKELGELSVKAREGKLKSSELKGGCFTISSLGGIGGTAFTPIVNVPEVAILGVSRSSMKPVYQDGEFVPRLMLPLSLSYDHRVIDGAEGARFITYLSKALAKVEDLIK